jgi:hypothetical protein
MLLAIERDPFVVDIAVQMDGKLGDAGKGTMDTKEARAQGTIRCTHDGPSCEAKVAVEPRI